MDANDSSLEETLRLLKDCVESAKYHEALHQYKTLARKKQSKVAANILSEGACTLLRHGQQKEGLELGILLIDHLDDHDPEGLYIFAMLKHLSICPYVIW